MRIFYFVLLIASALISIGILSTPYLEMRAGQAVLAIAVAVATAFAQQNVLSFMYQH